MPRNNIFIWKAEEIRKTGLRMEQKVEKVVSEAAAKLKQSTKNAIDTEINKLDLKTTNEIENITKKLQNVWGRKAGGL